MSDRRKHRLIDCRPRWVEDPNGVVCYLHFDCPEAHEGCGHTIPFAPALDGSTPALSVLWQRQGDAFEALTLTPSIRRFPVFENRDQAIAKGCLPQFLDDEHLYCAMHVNLTNGTFEFCGDSR